MDPSGFRTSGEHQEAEKMMKNAQTEFPIFTIHETDALSDKFYLTVYSVGYGLSQCPVVFLNDLF